jgi:hypothetical protein
MITVSMLRTSPLQAQGTECPVVPDGVACRSMIRCQLLKRLEREWRAFMESYAGLSDAELMEAGVTGAWSVRDIIAHVTTWEEEALKHLPSILAGRRPPRYSIVYGGIDGFNALMSAKKEGLSLSEVFRQQEEIHRRVVDLIERAPETQLIGETRFRRRLRLDTYGHYRLHARAIRRWRQPRHHT